MRYPFFVRKFENENEKDGIYTDQDVGHMMRVPLADSRVWLFWGAARVPVEGII